MNKINEINSLFFDSLTKCGEINVALLNCRVTGLSIVTSPFFQQVAPDNSQINHCVKGQLMDLKLYLAEFEKIRGKHFSWRCQSV